MACQLTFSARVGLFLFAQVRAINSYQLYHACNNEKFHIHAEFRMGDIFGAGVLINDASHLLFALEVYSKEVEGRLRQCVSFVQVHFRLKIKH